MDRQIAAMAQTTVAANLDQPLNIHLHLAAQVAFHFIVLRNVIPQQAQVGLGQILHPDIGIHLGRRQDLVGPAWADSEQIVQRYFDPLIARKINTFNSRHMLLSLSLLMLWVLANHKQITVSFDDLALGTTFFDGW